MTTKKLEKTSPIFFVRNVTLNALQIRIEYTYYKSKHKKTTNNNEKNLKNLRQNRKKSHRFCVKKLIYIINNKK